MENPELRDLKQRIPPLCQKPTAQLRSVAQFFGAHAAAKVGMLACIRGAIQKRLFAQDYRCPIPEVSKRYGQRSCSGMYRHNDVEQLRV